MVSCWEIAIKAGLENFASANRRRPSCLGNWPPTISLLRIELAHVTLVETLPPHHKDPFDRLLIAQAIIEKRPLVSADAVFDEYGVTRLWN